MSVANLTHLGITLDSEINKNKGGEHKISSSNSLIDVWVIPTNEELEIARQSFEFVS